MIRRIVGSIRGLWAGERVEADLDEELAFHVERETEQNVRRGMAPEEARRAALVRFGGIDKIKDESREASRALFFETLVQDVRYGLRSLRKNPGYAVAAVMTLALGIGANSAIFSVVHGVLLQQLPYGGGEKLVRIQVDAPGAGISDGRFAPLEVEDLRTQSRTLESVVEYHSMWFVLLGGTEPERVQTGVVSANFFDVLGVKPILGRTFLPGEDKHGAEAVLVLSHDYFMRAFGGDASVVGRVFRMNDRPHTVVGVLPPIPGYPEDNDVYMPVSACPFRSDPEVENNRDAGMLLAFARRKPSAPLPDVRRDLGEIAARLEKDHPKNYPAAARLAMTPQPLSEELTRRARPTFLLLFGTVGLVLLLACANVANLSLARLIRREKEMALRSALGAGRGRLTRQLLTESVLLAFVGGALGLVFAAAGRGLLVHFAQRFTPRASEIAIDTPVLLFTIAVSLVVGVGLGLIPAISGRRSLVSALQEGKGEGSATAGGRLGIRNMLIVAQVAISFVLLAGAGLMLRTLWKLSNVDPGFRTERILTSRLDLNFSRYKTDEERRAFQVGLLDRLQAEPGVQSVALAGSFPLNERGPANGRFEIEGRPPVAVEARPRADFQRVSPDYFKTISVPILRGRSLSEGDREGAPFAAVINQSLARHYWPGEDPVGRRIGVDNGPETKDWITIVGVVGDVRQYGLADPPVDQIYVAMRQYPGLSTTCLLRTAVEPERMERTVRAAVHAIGPEQPVDRFRTMAEVRSGALDNPRLTAVLLAAFAGLALVITATGIAGVIGFSVGQRRREFGIRMALGALPGTVQGMVLKQGMRLVLAGLALGLAGAFVVNRLWAGLLYEVAPSDPITYSVVAFGLGLIAAAACLVPARRATAVDPMVALRSA